MRVAGYLEECLPATALRDRGAKADLIVIGSHREGPIVRAILGSTARELLRDAAVPLCIVPTPAGQEDPHLVPTSSSEPATGD